MVPLLILLPYIALVFLWPNRLKLRRFGSEPAPSLPSPDLSSGSAYVNAANNSFIRPESQNAWVRRFRKFMILYPYFWPQNNHSLKFRIRLVGLCTLVNNGINILNPRQLGILLNSPGTLPGKSSWLPVAIFMALRLLLSKAGIPLMQKIVWLKVEQYWDKTLNTAAFSHIICLSADFHDSIDHSKLNTALASREGISHIAKTACFQAIPTIINLIIATTYL